MLNFIIVLTVMLLLPYLTNRYWLYMGISMFYLTFMSLLSMYCPILTPQKINYLFIMDSLSSPLIVLLMWLSALMMFCSSYPMKYNNSPKSLMVLINMLTLILLMTFLSSNMMLFYMMFEASLIPTLLIIMGWGYQPERLQASMYFMMYTITASLPLLINILFMYKSSGQLSLFMFTFRPMPLLPPSQTLWWLLTIMAFMVKMPLYSVHLWLPKAHVEAPVAGSMILAGILLKLGSYGLIRMSFFAPTITYKMSSLMSSLSLWGAFITSLICIRQSDMKSLIAYSSVGHMGLIIAASFMMSSWGWQSALIMMIAHGLSSSGLFALANLTYESTNTRSIFLVKGILSISPSISLWWFLMSISNMAAPPSINFLGEVTLMMSIIFFSKISMILLVMISFLAAAYSLYLYTAINHGTTSSYYTNMPSLYPISYSMISMHFIPVYMLILKPDLIFLWI